MMHIWWSCSKILQDFWMRIHYVIPLTFPPDSRLLHLYLNLNKQDTGLLKNLLIVAKTLNAKPGKRRKYQLAGEMPVCVTDE